MKKTAIVTGGSRGIGLAIAKQLGLDGYQIAIAATGHISKYEEQLAWFQREGIPSHYIQGSIDKKEDRQKIISETVQTFGGIHVLINNAGVAPAVRADLLEMTEESYDRVMNINSKGTMFLTQAAAKQMISQPLEKRRGVIINITSCSSSISSINRGEYCISKAAQSMITTLYADRLAEEGILVHEVRPGVIRTDMTSGVTEKYDKLFEEGAFPIKRWGTPEDVAGVVSALCSEKFLYTTGNYIDVDGGFHIKRL